jgi:hypothetical protein
MAAPTPPSAHGVADPHEPDEDSAPSQDEIAHLRAAALRDLSLVRAALDTCGAEFAARVYTARLVEVVCRARRGAPGAARLRLHTLGGGAERP